ncbi:alpha/beta fold hydrolase [Algoriphagus aestuarii]|nr:alpha/beta fold hydrolase [Algoriphagus aestuarii]
MKITVLLFFLQITFGLINQGFAIDPDREYIRTPDSVSWDYEQLTITTKDNFKLNSWIYQANRENDKDTVLVLAYPDAGNMSYFVYHAAILANAGYTVVTFDYRGFGKSDDFEIQRDYLYYTEFTLDLEAVVDNVSMRFDDKKIGVLGMSMGTTIASRAYPHIKSKIDFIIGEGYVSDTSKIVKRYSDLGKQLTLPEDSADYQKSVNSIEVPLLILAASEDTITTYEDALALGDKLGENCRIVQFEGEHLSGFQVEYDQKGFGGWYLEQIDQFLNEM